VTALLAPDPALPRRDELLWPAAPDVTVVRCKYRVGESLRVLYRAGDRLVTTRMRAGERPRWWAFPDDRRLARIADLMAPTDALRALTNGRQWVASEVAEYAPERSLTVRAIDGDGRAVAYVKLYAPGSRDVATLARRYRELAAATDAPTALGCCHDVVVLDVAPGRRWADVPRAEVVAVVGRLGAAIARLHGVTTPAGTPAFGRLGPARLAGAAAAIGAARPDVAAAVRAVQSRLEGRRRDDDDTVLLHGDCHPKNALDDGHRLTLIDLDQAGIGAAAADLGSFLARLRVGTITGQHTAAEERSLAATFLAGYAGNRPVPSCGDLAWHTAAALIAEQAVRAVNRVRPAVLSRLTEVVDAARELLA
jgi:aminoglycoside phosphotransferase (APT) family kinase protein